MRAALFLGGIALSTPGAERASRRSMNRSLQYSSTALDEQGVLDACLAIEERAGFRARPEAWW